VKLGDLGIGMDQYDRRARLMPALLVILPATLAVVALAPDAVLGWGGGIALIVQAGGSFLLAQFVGDIGKRKEPKLFEFFGGRPTERLLSHQHAPNRVILADRHKRLRKLFGRPVGGFGRAPFVIEGRALIFIESDPGGDACHLVSGFCEEVLQETLGGKARVAHTHCQSYGDDVCRWEGDLAEEPATVSELLDASEDT